MIEIEKLRPKLKERVMNLVASAGIDISDWGFANNPKYCFEWAFVQPGKFVVLNLWHEFLKEEGHTIHYEQNIREIAGNRSGNRKPIQIRRANFADEAIRVAFEGLLPIRAIINDGDRRKDDSPDPSKVRTRMLDHMFWHVSTYDYITGNFVLVRGPRGQKYVDQFSAISDTTSVVAMRTVTGEVFLRDEKIRKAVLLRAGGLCELCREPGFSMPNGAVYLETHHINPLSEGGPDIAQNMVALCPNHHRRAHFGVDRAELRIAFIRIVEQTAEAAMRH